MASKKPSPDRKVVEPGTDGDQWTVMDKERMQQITTEADNAIKLQRDLIEKHPELAAYFARAGTGPAVQVPNLPQPAAATPAAPSGGMPDFPDVMAGAPDLPQMPGVVAPPAPKIGNLQGGLNSARDDVTAGTNAGISAANEANAGIDGATQLGQAAAKSEYEQNHAVSEAQKGDYSDDLTRVKLAESSFATAMVDIEARRSTAFNRYLENTDNLQNTHVYSWWASASTGAKILGIISQALAGGLQGLSGQNGPTPLDRVIEQDLQLQKTNLAQKSDVAQQSAGLYQTLLGELKDRKMTEGAMRDIAYGSTIQRLKDHAGIVGDKDKPALQKLLADLEQKRAENRATVYMYAGKLAQQDGLSKGEFGEKYNALWATARGQDMDLLGKQAAQGTPVGHTNIDGFELYRKADKEGARDLEKKISGSEMAIKAVSQLQKAIGEYKTTKDGKRVFVPRTTDRLTLDQIADSAILQVKNIEALGAISEGDRELASGEIGATPGFGAALLRKLGYDSNEAMFKRLQRFKDNTRQRLSFDVSRIAPIGPDGKKYPLRYTPDPE